MEDAPAMAQLANDKRIWDNLRDYFPHPYELPHAQEFISYTTQQDPACNFAIVYEDQFAGIISLVEQPDVYQKSWEIGYWLGAPFWGRGIATQAVKLICQYGFEQLDCNRIFTGVFAYNLASMKVLEKCGFSKEGVFAQAIWKNHQFWDEHRFALLKD